MNNNKTFSTTTTINEDYMSFPYNDNYCSQPLLHFSPSSSINDLLIHSNSNTSNNHLDHHHQFLQAASPFSQFEFVQDFALLPSFLPQNIGHNDHQPISSTNNHHHPSLLPLNNTTGESKLIEPSETITTHNEDSQIISTSQDPKMKKAKKPSRTDRHSKIKTAKGTRDRRMRLSLDVAKALFGLQDMLGFDKASKTVEWLLTQAKPEIIKIANQFNHRGFSSGEDSQTGPALGSTETSSDLCELSSMWTVDDRGSNTSMNENKVDRRTMRGKRNMSQRTPMLKEISKDDRAKARERAKDRTMEKMMKKRAQVNAVEEVEAHNHHDEVVKNNNNNTDVNWTTSFEATPCGENMEELCKNNRFAIYNDFVVNKKDNISDESYNMISKLDPSFPMLTHHCIQGASTSIEQQYQVRDVHHFLGRQRDFMSNYHNM
ncbi:unnamed protein product [Eruca vesicaria subsp. sativa]|uniref:Uncharacterized protein n=1 Tax=Eruca vesicaria subsp. sativa TaxID=29727 RepID=A0ABC8M6H2_ERUVS|nr:unnamed protein product [Eruca vesicaria subsp. sativa]